MVSALTRMSSAYWCQSISLPLIWMIPSMRR
jgi:hypothetical protein